MIDDTALNANGDTAVALTQQVMERLEVMEQRLALVTELAALARSALATLTDSADEAFARASATGPDVDARARAVGELARRLSEPRTVAALGRLLDRIDTVDRAVGLLERVPGFAALTVDAIDELYERTTSNGLDPEMALRRAGSALLRLTTPAALEALETLLHSPVLDPSAVRVIGNAAQALVSSRREEWPRVGPLAALRMFRNPDVQRSMGFLLAFAAAFGRTLAGDSQGREHPKVSAHRSSTNATESGT